MQKMQETLAEYLGLVIPWRKKWQPTPVFLHGESHDRGVGWVTVPGVKRFRHDLAHSTAVFNLGVLIYLILIGSEIFPN